MDYYSTKELSSSAIRNITNLFDSKNIEYYYDPHNHTIRFDREDVDGHEMFKLRDILGDPIQESKKLKSTKLTPSQVKLKNVLKPMVENIILEKEKGNYYDFLTMFQQKFSQNMLAINKHLKDALDEKPNFVTDYLEDYFDSTNNPNFYDAFIKLTKNVLYKFKK